VRDAAGADAAAVLRWTELRTRLALAAHSARGGAREVLGLATSYAGTRVQFGRPIGSFQAIKHKLAWLNQTWLGGEAAMPLSVADLLAADAGLPQPDGAPAEGRTAWSAV